MAAGKIGMMLALALTLAGCVADGREKPKFPKPVKPSSATIQPEQLTEAEIAWCRKNPTGMAVCRKFFINAARQRQNQRFINRVWRKWPG